jgi:hypothetical protein
VIVTIFLHKPRRQIAYPKLHVVLGDRRDPAESSWMLGAVYDGDRGGD